MMADVLRIALLMSLMFTPLFAKEDMVVMACGCPSTDSYLAESDKRCLPGPLNGLVTSMKCCPGIWTVSAVALAVGGVAYALADSPTTSTVHYRID